MAEKEHSLSQNRVNRIGREVHAVGPQFDAEVFARDIVVGFPRLGLKDRIARTSKRLSAHLPSRPSASCCARCPPHRRTRARALPQRQGPGARAGRAAALHGALLGRGRHAVEHRRLPDRDIQGHQALDRRPGSPGAPPGQRAHPSAADLHAGLPIRGLLLDRVLHGQFEEPFVAADGGCQSEKGQVVTR